MNKNRNRWTKIVALVVILAMVIGGLAAGLIAAFSSGPDVSGTYKASDGRQMVLKNGTATITVPGQSGSATAKYKVSGDEVIIQVDQKNQVVFQIDGKDLVIQGGGSVDRWTRQ
jgi:hypothetical protein